MKELQRPFHSQLGRIQESMNNSAVEVGPYTDLYSEWGPTKFLALVSFLMTQTMGNGLLVGIVWYERHGSDGNYRTLINQLTSSFCTTLVVMNLTLTNMVAYAHIFGPLGDATCSLMVFGSNFFLTLGLLYLDTIIILRYLYIFRWKTVGAINDDLFALFATINNVVIAFLVCFVLYVLGFNYNINYQICVNKPPGSLNTNSNFRLPVLNIPINYSYDIFCVLPTFSYIIHIFVFIKIFLFRKQDNNNLILEEQNRNIADLCSSVLVMGMIFLSSIPTVLIMVYFDSQDLLMQPGRSCVFFAHFGIQFVTAIPLPLIHYSRNSNLRNAVARKLKFVKDEDEDEDTSKLCCFVSVRDWWLRMTHDKVPQSETIGLSNL